MMSTRTSLAQRPRQPVLITSQRLPTKALTPFSASCFTNAASTSLAPMEIPPVPWQIRIFIASFSLMTNCPLLESFELLTLFHWSLVVVGNDFLHLLDGHRTVGSIIDHCQRRHTTRPETGDLLEGVAQVRTGFRVTDVELVKEGFHNTART